MILDLRDTELTGRVIRNRLSFGDGPDILVNAAGILHTSGVETIDIKDWDESFAINVRGPLKVIQELLPCLKASPVGAVINIGSNASHIPRWGMAAYGASKAALRYLTMSLGLELAKSGVTCNLVSPGSVDTAMQRQLWDGPGARDQVIAGEPDRFRNGIPLGKLAEPSDIASTVLFLASDDARHITMQDIVVDGGAILGA